MFIVYFLFIQFATSNPLIWSAKLRSHSVIGTYSHLRSYLHKLIDIFDVDFKSNSYRLLISEPTDIHHDDLGLSRTQKTTTTTTGTTTRSEWSRIVSYKEKFAKKCYEVNLNSVLEGNWNPTKEPQKDIQVLKRALKSRAKTLFFLFRFSERKCIRRKWFCFPSEVYNAGMDVWFLEYFVELNKLDELHSISRIVEKCWH